MNKIEFKTLEIQNFFSFTDNQIFKFPESGLFLIRGENHDFQMNVFSDDIKKMNGCGKSSIIKALNWVIFGENPDKKICGGYSGSNVLYEHFLVKFLDGISFDKAGPIFWAGITMYDTLITYGAT